MQQALESIEILFHSFAGEIHPFVRHALGHPSEHGTRLDDRIEIVGRFLRSFVDLINRNAEDAAELIGGTLRQARRNLRARLQRLLNGLDITLEDLRPGSRRALAGLCGDLDNAADLWQT